MTIVASSSACAPWPARFWRAASAAAARLCRDRALGRVRDPRRDGTNRPVIEVLHLIGAKDSFIAGHFQRHFLLLGLEGGLIGGGSAIALFALAELTSGRLVGTAGGDQFTALFGSSSIGALGYLAVLAQVGLIAFVTAATSRFTVNRTIETIY
jgi:Cell division protein